MSAISVDLHVYESDTIEVGHMPDGRPYLDVGELTIVFDMAAVEAYSRLVNVATQVLQVPPASTPALRLVDPPEAPMTPA